MKILESSENERVNVENTSKRKRGVSKACFSCHSSKLRCDGKMPCFRCIESNKECSYLSTSKKDIELHLTEFIKSTNSQMLFMNKQIGELQSKVDSMMTENRQSPRLQLNELTPDNYSGSSDNSPRTKKQKMAIQNISLQSAPMKTVQSAMNSSGIELDQLSTEIRSPLPLLQSLYQETRWTIDPVILGIITESEAQSLIDIYFKDFHYMAPLLTVSIYSDAGYMRKTSMLLFLTVCSVAARCWFNENDSHQHRKYKHLAMLLDFALSKDIIHVKSGEISLELLEALQVYAHWMPLNFNHQFNENSAWNIIGLAIRSSKFLDLEKRVLNDFYNEINPTIESFRMLRVLLNLLSLDYQLMLSSRLPTSIDPIPLVPIARSFHNHPNSEPDDIRLWGLCELTLTLNQAFQRGQGLLEYDSKMLRNINLYLDDWLKAWKPKLTDTSCGTQLLISQIPFTSMRWYMITLNSLPLSRLFMGSNIQDQDEQLVLTSLSRCVHSAVEMLSCFFVDEEGNRVTGYVPLSSEKWNSLVIDSKILSKFLYAVDSYWMTHAFAIILLCILYSRGAIDDYLFCKIPSGLDKATTSPGVSSPLHKLLLVGCELFFQLEDCTWHPAYHLKNIVFDIYESVTHIEDEETEFNFRDLFHIPLDNGFDLGFFLNNNS